MAKNLTRQQRKFQSVARKCHAKLRAGQMTHKGEFGRCMKTGMRKRS